LSTHVTTLSIKSISKEYKNYEKLTWEVHNWVALFQFNHSLWF